LISPQVNYAVSNASFNLSLNYNLSGSIQSKNQIHYQDSNINPLNTYENTYHYTVGSHKLEILEDMQTGNVENFEYDSTGNLVGHYTPTSTIKQYWDESERLKAYSNSDTGVYQYYVYDDKGERAIKYDLLNDNQLYQNGVLVDEGQLIMNNFKVYPNPYLVITPASMYTKHYYAGSQRVASRLLEGSENFADQSRGTSKDKSKEDVDVVGDFYRYMKMAGFDTSKLDGEYSKNLNTIADIYYYHGDHLGSSTYITDSHAITTQFFLNLPFGETMAEQMTGVYDNPYKFNAKELDSGTGLYYYGARYYNPRLSIWYGVDPLAEKFPNWSPYVYVKNAPVTHIDPDGMEALRWPPKTNWQTMHKEDIDHLYPKSGSEAGFETLFSRYYKANSLQPYKNSKIITTRFGKSFKPDAKSTYQHGYVLFDNSGVSTKFKENVSFFEITTAKENKGAIRLSDKNGQPKAYIDYLYETAENRSVGGYRTFFDKQGRFNLVTLPDITDITEIKEYGDANKVDVRHYVPYYRLNENGNVDIEFRQRKTDFFGDQSDESLPWKPIQNSIPATPKKN